VFSVPEKYREQNLMKISSCGRTPTHQTSARFLFDVVSWVFFDVSHQTSWNNMKHLQTSWNIIEQNLTKISLCGQTLHIYFTDYVPNNFGMEKSFSCYLVVLISRQMSITVP
jgi:hypothetical protein